MHHPRRPFRKGTIIAPAPDVHTLKFFDMIQKVTAVMNGEGRFRPADGRQIADLNPKELLLFAAADCAGRTITALMKDRKSAIKSFEIAIEGTLSTPTLMAESRYTTINILYNIECRTLKEQIEISRAVNLAHDKYCGLVQMLKMIAPVQREISIVATDQVTA